ncbi:hypothetical protein FOCC_FOCC001868 [Frankliniella occidentalis]|uniref:peptidylprolyl isomerase n=1 Tax=Frankliniella occidentalis TaxID=133901 RepID=A0A6J1TJ00_FRAOC|nr:peptidyl-prolyl cis-trans isomerase G [Frankliniella occidentalis]KAE8751297.1 hypothetical protein FOCC_FOCC001868 [Frankliniella occidentalis]
MMTVGTEVRPRCFFDVEIGGLPMGRIVFELYTDICPITAENFRALCTGEKGLGKTSGKPLHYQGIVFHRVVRDFMIQSGDFTVGNGSGGESIYGGTFEDENLEMKHDKPFLLSMANRGKDTNGSQFFITTQPAPHLDGVHVVFGHVVAGKEVVSQIEVLPVDRNSRPLQDAKVSKCGELVLLSKSKGKKKKKKAKKEDSESSSSSESSASAEESGSEEESKKKKKAKKEKASAKEEDDQEEEEGEYHPLVSVTKIDPSEIPEVPSNKFLYRDDGRSKDFKNDGRERDPKRARERERGGRPDRDDRGNRDYRDNRSDKGKIRGMTKSGRVIKGRGVFRFRTPSRSRSRSRSATPPHWKQAAKRTIKLSEFERMEAERKTKDEEIARREDARRKRHEERQREQKEHFQKLKQEAEQHFQKSKDPHDTSGKRDEHHQNKKANPAKNNEESANTSGPLDLNALDYESMDLGEDDEVHKAGASDGESRGLQRNGKPAERKRGSDKEKAPERARNKGGLEEERGSRPSEKRASSQTHKNYVSSKDKSRQEKRDKDRRNAEKLAESDDDLEKEKERLKELEKLKQRMEQELAKEMKEKEKMRDVDKKRERDDRDRTREKEREKEKEKEHLRRKEEERKRDEGRKREELRRKEEERRRRDKESRDRRDKRRSSEDRSKRRRSRSKSRSERKRGRRHSSTSSSSSSSTSSSSSSSSDDNRRRRR